MSTAATRPSLVDRAVIVRLPLDEAWLLFTARLREWWPLTSHSCSRDPRATVVFEPRAGGDVVEITPDGRHHPWGRLTEWTPPHGFAMTWHPAQPAENATRVRVTFTTLADGTEVRVRHDGWEARGAAAEAMRDEYDRGWPLVLQQLALAAAAEPNP